MSIKLTFITATNQGLALDRLEAEAHKAGLRPERLIFNDGPPEIQTDAIYLRHTGLNYHDKDLTWAESLSCFVYPDPALMRQLRGKERQAEFFKALALPHPQTLAVRTALESLGALKEGAYIVKPERSLQGKGIVFVESKRSLKTLLEALLLWKDERFVVQPYLNKKIEWRMLFTPARMTEPLVLKKRIDEQKDVRGNRSYHLGKLVPFAKCPAELQTLGLKAFQDSGLSAAGIDLVQVEERFVFLEINATPGFQSFEELTGLNIAQELLVPFTSGRDF